MQFPRVVALMLGLAGLAACGFPRPPDVGDDGGVGVDASTDGDAVVCLGSFLNICVKAPTQSVVITAPVTIDTLRSRMCAAVLSGGNYCVIAATDITTFQNVRATGPWPLVLLATGTIAIGALVDVGSHRGETPETGAGADPAVCEPGTPPEEAGSTEGGGAGGSFHGLGGRGGAGGATPGGIPGAAEMTVSQLRGGCAGQNGGTFEKAGNGGHGGGAVYFIAGNSIVLHGPIHAGGEGGGGAVGEPVGGGGGGGGAGGMIGFDAPVIMGDSSIAANGGAGGEGVSPFLGLIGHVGQDANTIDAARGGSLGDNFGGDGGDGCAGMAAASGKDGTAGVDSGEGDAGGGGGGGGAGLVKAPAHAQLGASVSPPPTP